MAKLNVFTLENLTLYDSLIKQYINAGDAKSFKSAKFDEATRVLSLFKNETPEGTADFTVEIPETDVSNFIEKITGATEGNVVVANADGTVKDGGVALADLATKEEVEAVDGKADANAEAIEALEGRADVLEETVAKLDGADTVEGSVKAQIKAAKEELEQKITDSEYDDTDVKAGIQENKEAIEAINNEETGILKQAKDYADGKDEAIAAAKKAGDDAQADVDALEEVVAENAEAAKVTLTTAETATEGYLKTYVISQGTTEVGKIDIPKELVVTGGEVVVNPEGQPEGTYVKLTIANQEAPIFINVKDLCDVYTAQQNATQVQLVISDTNEISATIVAGSVGTTELADGAVTAGKLADDAKALFDEAGAASTAEESAKTHADNLNTAMDERVKELEEAVGEDGAVSEQIGNAIAELDADVTSAAVEEGKGVQVQVVEVDGEVTTVNVTGNYDNAYDAKGSADAAETAANEYADGLNTAMDTRVTTVEGLVGEGYQAIPEADINALFA